MKEDSQEKNIERRLMPPEVGEGPEDGLKGSKSLSNGGT